jgi:hypothetical protein
MTYGLVALCALCALRVLCDKILSGEVTERAPEEMKIWRRLAKGAGTG